MGNDSNSRLIKFFKLIVILISLFIILILLSLIILFNRSFTDNFYQKSIYTIDDKASSNNNSLPQSKAYIKYLKAIPLFNEELKAEIFRLKEPPTNGSNIENSNNNDPNTSIPPNKDDGDKNSVPFENAMLDDGSKVAYLTFDDGPSTTVTPKILVTLKKYNINATFFLLGQNMKRNAQCRQLVSTIYSDGNSIGNHTYSHDLKKLYPNNKINVDYFMSEVNETDEIFKDILGNNFNTRLIRLPGGYMSRVYYKDPNLNLLDNKLKQLHLFSVDWNASDSDAEGAKKNAKDLLQMVKESTSGKNKVIILMHDTYGKDETSNALPSIIEYLKAQGYQFKTLR